MRKTEQAGGATELQQPHGSEKVSELESTVRILTAELSVKYTQQQSDELICETIPNVIITIGDKQNEPLELIYPSVLFDLFLTKR